MNERIKKELPVKLTAEEKGILADKLTEQIANQKKFEYQKKAVTKEYAARIEECISEINELSVTIRAGVELRMVECEVILNDPRDGLKTTYRLDTMELVDSVPMSLADMQMDMFEDVEIEDEDEDNQEEVEEDE